MMVGYTNSRYSGRGEPAFVDVDHPVNRHVLGDDQPTVVLHDHLLIRLGASSHNPIGPRRVMYASIAYSVGFAATYTGVGVGHRRPLQVVI
jgi:hypothetical protein